MENYFDKIAGGNKEKNYFQKIAVSNEEQEHQRKKEEEKNELRAIISTKLAEKTTNLNLFGNKDEKLIAQIRKWISEIIHANNKSLSNTEIKKLLHEMVLEITSLGKIHFLMEDKTVSEIMINAPNEVWVEKGGKLQLTDVKYDNNIQVTQLARKIVAHVGRRIDNTNPIEDARLPDGSRVHIVIPPIAMKGTTITIRKFFQEKLGIQDLIKFGTLDERAARFLEAAVKARANIIVSGGTGSGKTTTLNIMSNFVPNDERIITIEDSAELQLINDHVVKLESRPENAEGEGEVTIRDLIKASLRMRPERVIVGEVRDGSCFDLMQACNTGHDGSMGTVHANNPDLCVTRMENLILLAGSNMSPIFIRQLISEAVDLIVQISRLKDGTRKITHITEIAAYDHDNGRVLTKNIFEWRLTNYVDGKLQGEFCYTGHILTPQLLDKFEKHDIDFHSLVKEGA